MPIAPLPPIEPTPHPLEPRFHIETSSLAQSLRGKARVDKVIATFNKALILKAGGASGFEFQKTIVDEVKAAKVPPDYAGPTIDMLIPMGLALRITGAADPARINGTYALIRQHIVDPNGTAWIYSLEEIATQLSQLEQRPGGWVERSRSPSIGDNAHSR